MTILRVVIPFVIFSAVYVEFTSILSSAEDAFRIQESTRVHPEKTLELIKRIKDATESRVVVS